MAYSITITNTNNKKFRFFDGEVRNASYSLQNKIFKAEIPESKEPIIINLGISANVSFPFKLLNTPDDDAAVGTHSTQVKTIQQKFDYLDDVFITNGIDDKYSIELRHNGITITKVGVSFEDFTIEMNAENPNYVNGSFKLSGGI